MKKIIWIIGILIIIILISTEDKKEAGETLERDVSDSFVHPGGTFTLTYQVQNPAPPFFFSIKDVISGGCTSFGTTDITTTLTSPQTATGAITITAPATTGTCTFNGDWKLGAGNIVLFPSMTVDIISPSCTQDSECPLDTSCKDWSCSSGTCTSSNINEGGSCIGGTCQSGTCTPDDCTPAWTCTSWSTCSSSCTQTKTCTDSNSCGVTTGKPAESQSCTGGTCVPESCTTNSDCADKVCQTKSCDSGTCLYTITPTVSCVKSGNAGTCSSAGVCVVAAEDTCEFYQTEKSDGTCGMAGWVYLVIGVFAFIALMKAF